MADPVESTAITNWPRTNRLRLASPEKYPAAITVIIVIDEIGKMELTSERFISLIEMLWESDITVLSTIMYARQPICDRLKSDPRSEVFTLNRRNHKEVFDEIRNLCDLSSVV